MGKLEQEVAALRRELVSLKSDQEVMGKHMEGMLEQLKAARADVSPWSRYVWQRGAQGFLLWGLALCPVSGGSSVPSVGQSVPVTVPAGWHCQACSPAGRLARGAPGPGA